jgi:hypothetical protein
MAQLRSGDHMNSLLKTGYAGGLLLLASFASADAAIADAKAQLSGSSLVVTASLLGLPTKQSVTLRATATARVTYVCVNRGNNIPSSSNKTHTFTKTLSVSRDINTDDVRVTRQLTFAAPKASGFVCPPGQESKLASITYSNVRVALAGRGVSKGIAGTFSKTFVSTKK